MADVVVIDGPPLLVVADALTVARYVDAMLVVARIDRISRSVARETHRVLSRTSTPLLGIVTTGSRQTPVKMHGYYSDDSSGQAASSKPFADTPSLK
jgi:Mrp family chromosome partitioning ATPase